MLFRFLACLGQRLFALLAGELQNAFPVGCRGRPCLSYFFFILRPEPGGFVFEVRGIMLRARCAALALFEQRRIGLEQELAKDQP
jgi:hypothetical protein